MDFQRRELSQTATVGERLHQARERAGLSLDDLAAESKIQAKYLAAIEAGHYRLLPGPVYARNFIRKYAEVLNVDVAHALELFDQEYRIVTGGRVDRHLPSQRVSTEHHWLRRHARLLFAATFVAMVVIYFGLQVERLITPPVLAILAPSHDLRTHDRQIVVRGSTDVTASVTINTVAVNVDEQGNFSESIDLSPGLNTLEIKAAKKHRSARTITRQVLVE